MSLLFVHFFVIFQKDHPQNPIVRENCQTEEEKLCKALGLAAKGFNPKENAKAVRGYNGFLALLYAFTEQSACEVCWYDGMMVHVTSYVAPRSV